MLPALPGAAIANQRAAAGGVVSFVAEQIDVRPEAIDDYLAFSQNCRRHAAELQDRLRLRPFGKHAAAELATALFIRKLLRTIGSSIWPSWSWRSAADSKRSSFRAPRRLERLCVDLRFRARRETERRLTLGLSHEQRRQLDALTLRRVETSQSWLVRLRQMPQATKPASMLGLIARLNHVRAIGLDSGQQASRPSDPPGAACP